MNNIRIKISKRGLSRIGIHKGDILIQGDFGSGDDIAVAICSRLGIECRFDKDVIVVKSKIHENCGVIFGFDVRCQEFGKHQFWDGKLKSDMIINLETGAPGVTKWA